MISTIMSFFNNVEKPNIFNVDNWIIIDSVDKMEIFKDEENLIFLNMSLSLPFALNFKNCENSVFINCSESFIFSWMSPYKFSSVKTIYLESSMCDYEVFESWSNKKVIMYISPVSYLLNEKLSDEFNYTSKIDEVTHNEFLKKILNTE